MLSKLPSNSHDVMNPGQKVELWSSCNNIQFFSNHHQFRNQDFDAYQRKHILSIDVVGHLH